MPSLPSLDLLLLLISILPIASSHGFPRKLTSLYQPPPTVLRYHGGPLLQGHIPVSILWYGDFSPSQKSVIVDFLLSLTPHFHHPYLPFPTGPTVSHWWSTVNHYLQLAGKNKTHVSLATQASDPACSAGKSLTRSGIARLAARLAGPDAAPGGLAVVLTAGDVAVDGFCMSACGTHSSRAGARFPYVWVGDSASQCPGQCAWPFHEPVYGPPGPALRPPNGDVGADGMVVSLAALLAGAVTNPFGTGFFEGESGAPVEAGAACPGVFGPGAFPGYPGRVRVDSVTGASYNVQGVTGRKYLVPALFDPYTSSCLPMA